MVQGVQGPRNPDVRCTRRPDLCQETRFRPPFGAVSDGGGPRATPAWMPAASAARPDRIRPACTCPRHPARPRKSEGAGASGRSGRGEGEVCVSCGSQGERRAKCTTPSTAVVGLSVLAPPLPPCVSHRRPRSQDPHNRASHRACSPMQNCCWAKNGSSWPHRWVGSRPTLGPRGTGREEAARKMAMSGRRSCCSFQRECCACCAFAAC